MSAWQKEHCRRYQLALHLTRNTNRCMITKYNHHLFQNKNYEKLHLPFNQAPIQFLKNRIL